MALTKEQQAQYYATEGSKASPLSPTAWLAAQTGGTTGTTTPTTDTIASGLTDIQNQINTFSTDGVLDVSKITQPTGLTLGNDLSDKPNIDDSQAYLAGNEVTLTDWQKELADLKQQITDAQTNIDSSKSVFDKILNKPEKTTDELVQQYKELQNALYPGMAADLAEVKTLQDQYTALEAQKQAELDMITDQTVNQNILTRKLSSAEKRANIELNRVAGKINSKQSYIASMKGDMQESMAFIQQAVENATAEKRWEYEQYMDFVTLNENKIASLRSEYQQYLFKGLDMAETAWKTNKAEKEQVGEYMVEYNRYGAGITMDDTLEEAQAKAARVNPLPKSATQSGYYAGATNLTPFEAENVSPEKIIMDLVNSGIKDPQQLFDIINYDEAGNKIGNLSLSDIISELKTMGAIEPELTAAEQKQKIWQWLASEDAVKYSEEEQRAQIMAAGFDPKEFLGY